MWGMSWVNFTMDLATIPTTNDKNKPEDKHIAPDDEEAELRKDFGL